MKRFQYLAPLALALVGCTMCGSPTLVQTPAASVAPVRPGVIPIAPANAKIEFTGATAIMSQAGHFAGFDGTLEMPTEDPKDAKIHVVIDMDTTTTNIGLLTKHLKGEDFFDAAKYPKAEFTSQKIAPVGESGAYQVTGLMAFHGVQKSITFPARIAVTGDEVTFDATLAIKQTEFGMVEGAKKTKDEVPVTVSVRGRRK